MPGMLNKGESIACLLGDNHAHSFKTCAPNGHSCVRRLMSLSKWEFV